ncbi:MAG: hypothetical protein WBA74_25160, partial [Cyclobacteriaceae bacterium]
GDLTPLSVNASSANTANTIINRDASGDFAANDVTVNSLSATLVNGRNIVTDATNQDALQTASGIVQGSTDIGLVSNPVVTDNQTLLSAVLQLGTELNNTNTNVLGIPTTTNVDGTTILGDGDLTPLSVNASSANTANTIINRDASGNFAANDVTVNNLSATLVNGRNITADATNQDAMQTLTGYAAGTDNMGVSGGSIISNGADFQTAFSELEFAIDNVAGISGLSSGTIPYFDGLDFQDSPLNFNSTNLGIGTITPATKFHLYEPANQPLIQTIAVDGSQPNQQAGISFMSQSGAGDFYSTPSTRGWLLGTRGASFSDASQQNDLIFSYNEGSGDNNILVLDNGGFVGINAGSDPLSDLQIQSSTHMYESAGDAYLTNNIHDFGGSPYYTNSGEGLSLSISQLTGFDFTYFTPGSALGDASGNAISLLTIETNGDAVMAGNLDVASIFSTDMNTTGTLTFLDNGSDKFINMPSSPGGSNGYDLYFMGSDGDAGFNGGDIIMNPGVGLADGQVISNGDLLVAHNGTSPGKLILDGGPSGGNFVSLEAPASTFSDYSLIFPPDAGTSGQVLTSLDGTGVLAWSDVTTPTLTDITLQQGANRTITIEDELSGTAAGHDLTIQAGNAAVSSGQGAGDLYLSAGFADSGIPGLVNITGEVTLLPTFGTSPGYLWFSDGTDQIGISIPEGGVTTYELTLPDSPGSNGQVLTTDGTGWLSWTSPDLSFPYTAAPSVSGSAFQIENLQGDNASGEFVNSSNLNSVPGLIVHNRDEANGSGGVLSLGVTDDGGGMADGVFLESRRTAPGPSLAAEFVVSTLDGAGVLQEGLRISPTSDVTISNGNLIATGAANVFGTLTTDGGININGGGNVNGNFTIATGNVGIKTISPRGDLDVNGSLYLKVRTVNNNDNVGPEDYHLFCDGSIGGAQSFIISLPPSDGSQLGRKLEFSTADQGGDSLYDIDPNGATIFYQGLDVTNTLSIGTTSGQSTFVSMTLVSANVWVVSAKTDAG